MRSCPTALRALQGFRNGTTVYVGGNPITSKLRLGLVEPRAVPGCAAGTVATSATSTAAHTSVIQASGRGDAASPRDSVTLKLHKELPDRPRLARSLAAGLHSVSSQLDTVAPEQLKFTSLDHDKLVEVFDQLQSEIDSWQALATVQEDPAEHGAMAVGQSAAPVAAPVELVRLRMSSLQLFIICACLNACTLVAKRFSSSLPLWQRGGDAQSITPPCRRPPTPHRCLSPRQARRSPSAPTRQTR